MTDTASENRRKPLSREVYDKFYDKFILNKTFVEDPKYYELSRERYWRAAKYFERLNVAEGGKVFDIGGGQFGILTHELFGVESAVGDVNRRAEVDVRAAGLGFETINLMRDEGRPADNYDCITLLEVIEHIPDPAYVVLNRLNPLLKPGGTLLLTTPNGYRFRNVLYMLANKRILDNYRYPEGDVPMGHMIEYRLEDMLWHAGQAGFEVLFAERYDSGFAGSTPLRRVARRAARIVDVVPHLRDSLVMGLRKPAA
jgi:2-polyprenyl-3-methyl-5-hydroxy-6-metoxy-1,4-benzoquinol methylase